MSNLRMAAKEYLDRKDRISHPDGKFDNARRWYPSEAEECECCTAIGNPTRNYRYTLMTHCRSVKHIANLFGVDYKKMLKTVKEIK